MVSEAISSTTRPETEPGPRPVKVGLGDQESGVSGVDEAAQNTSLPLSKRVRSAVSECATFSDFGRADNEDVSDNRNGLNISHHHKLDMHTIQLLQSVSALYHSKE